MFVVDKTVEDKIAEERWCDVEEEEKTKERG